MRGASIFYHWAFNPFVGEFVDLLRPQEIKLVVDVRTIPRSRTNPSTIRRSSRRLWLSFKSTMSTSRRSEACVEGSGR